MKRKTRRNKTFSVMGQLRLLVFSVSVLLVVILALALVMLISANSHYPFLMHNTTTAGLVVEAVILAAIAAVAIFLLVRYSVKLSRTITTPLVALSQRAEEVGKGDLRQREPVRSEVQEIDTLSVGMEQMIAQLNRQMQEAQQRQESLRKTELALLQAQINPHFLYNTMDTIIWLMEAEKTQEAVQMVSDLSGFFRHSLSRGEDVISLEEEESHVRSYLQIQQVRYHNILTYTVDIDPALHDALLPKLTLQPLVENSLYHGIKLKRAMGAVRISGRRDGEHIVLQVSDDGAGMSQERLEQVRRAMDDRDERVGFGLSAVNQRLRLQFGDEYGLHIDSRAGVGTAVTARIPYLKKDIMC